jgi:hypothetical protein
VGLLMIWGGAAGRGAGRPGAGEAPGRAGELAAGRAGIAAPGAAGREGAAGRLAAGGSWAGRGLAAGAGATGRGAAGGALGAGGVTGVTGAAGLAGGAAAGRCGGAATAEPLGFPPIASEAAFFTDRMALPGAAGGAVGAAAAPPLSRPINERMRRASSSLIELLWLRAAIFSFSAASSTSLLSRPRSRDSS